MESGRKLAAAEGPFEISAIFVSSGLLTLAPSLALGEDRHDCVRYTSLAEQDCKAINDHQSIFFPIVK